MAKILRGATRGVPGEARKQLLSFLQDTGRLGSGVNAVPASIVVTLIAGLIIGAGIAGSVMLLAGVTPPISLLQQRPVVLGSLGTCELNLLCINDPALAAGWKPFCDAAKDDAACSKFGGCTWVPSAAISNPVVWPVKNVCWPIRPGIVVQRLADRTYVTQDSAGNLIRVRNVCR